MTNTKKTPKKNDWTAENMDKLLHPEPSVREKITNGSYQNSDPYPEKKQFDDKAVWAAARQVWGQKSSDLCQQFKKDVLAELGLTNHPKAERFIELAWDYGDKDFRQVLETAEELSELLSD